MSRLRSGRTESSNAQNCSAAPRGSCSTTRRPTIFYVSVEYDVGGNLIYEDLPFAARLSSGIILLASACTRLHRDQGHPSHIGCHRIDADPLSGAARTSYSANALDASDPIPLSKARDLIKLVGQADGAGTDNPTGATWMESTHFDDVAKPGG